MNSEHGEVKEHAYKSERKEPIKPEPGPDWPLQASAEDICSAHFSKLHGAASDKKISWSLAERDPRDRGSQPGISSVEELCEKG